MHRSWTGHVHAQAELQTTHGTAAVGATGQADPMTAAAIATAYVTKLSAEPAFAPCANLLVSASDDAPAGNLTAQSCTYS
jgi:hypothetical protein